MSKQLHYIYMVFGYQLTQNLCFSFPFNLNSHHGLEQAFEKLSNGMNMYAPGQKAAICDIWLPIFGSHIIMLAPPSSQWPYQSKIAGSGPVKASLAVSHAHMHFR